MTLYRQITAKYAPNVPIQSFGQMGFFVGRFVTQALLSVDGRVTAKSYNNAVRALKNVKSDISASRGTSETRFRTHPEQHGHHGYLRQREAEAGRPLLPDPGCRSAAEEDPRVGEEVQAEYREVADEHGIAGGGCSWNAAAPGITLPQSHPRPRESGHRSRGPGDIGAECIASWASRLRCRLGVHQAVHHSRPRPRRGVRLSGVSLVVLYRSTGVLNLAFGAIGTAGALIA